MSEVAQAKYVKELFENNFIDKLLTYLYSEEIAIKKYNINIEEIKQQANKLQNKRQGNQYLKEVYLPTKGLSKEEHDKRYHEYNKEVSELNKLMSKYNFIPEKGEKYTFDLFLQQIYFKDIHEYFFENTDFNLTEEFLNECSISLDELTEDNNNSLSDICNTILPFDVDKSKEEKFDFQYMNRDITFLKAYKIILEEIFNCKIEDLQHHCIYQSYVLFADDKDSNDFQVDAIFHLVKQRFLSFRQSFFDFFESFIQFGFTEALIFSSKNQLDYRRYALLDKDKKKTHLYKNVIEKLLGIKQKMYRKIANIPLDRRGGDKKAIIPRILEKYSPAEIFKYWSFTKQIRQGKRLEEGSLKEYDILMEVFNKKVESGYAECKTIMDYIKNSSKECEPKILALEMFISEENLPVKAMALNKELKKRKIQ